MRRWFFFPLCSSLSLFLSSLFFHSFARAFLSLSQRTQLATRTRARSCSLSLSLPDASRGGRDTPAEEPQQSKKEHHHRLTRRRRFHSALFFFLLPSSHAYPGRDLSRSQVPAMRIMTKGGVWKNTEVSLSFYFTRVEIASKKKKKKKTAAVDGVHFFFRSLTLSSTSLNHFFSTTPRTRSSRPP